MLGCSLEESIVPCTGDGWAVDVTFGVAVVVLFGGGGGGGSWEGSFVVVEYPSSPPAAPPRASRIHQ